MIKDLLKKILATVYLLIIFVIVFFIFFNKDLFLNLNFEDIQSNYEKLKILINNNNLISISLFLLLSIIWILFGGIVSPLLFISTILFGYFGILISVFSFTLGSILTFIIANIFKSFLIKNLINSFRVPYLKDDSIFLFALFRLIPGIPFVIKNLFAIFFNITYRKFILATILAETPQIVLYTYIFKKVIDNFTNFGSELSFNTLTSELFLPSILLLIFFIILFILKKKYSKYFSQLM